LRCLNNAGISSYGSDGQRLAIGEIDLPHFDHVLSVNLIASFMLSKAVLPRLRAHGWGRLVHIASRGGRTFSDVFPSSFSASKAGLIGLSRSLAGEAGAIRHHLRRYRARRDCDAAEREARSVAATRSKNPCRPLRQPARDQRGSRLSALGGGGLHQWRGD
jgi:hypothetical protein